MDSYGLIEFVLNTQAYRKYQNTPFYTTYLNLYEVTVFFRRKGQEDLARSAFDNFKKNVIQVSESIYFNAAALKVSHRQLSNVDCIGYLVAQNLGVPFVTGDDGFKEFPNVIFVK